MAFTGTSATAGNITQYSFNVTETAGGTACPWQAAASGIAVLNPNPTNGQNAGVGTTVPPSVLLNYQVGAATVSVQQGTVTLAYQVGQSNTLTVTQEALDSETQTIIAGASLTTAPLSANVPNLGSIVFVPLAGTNLCNVVNDTDGGNIDSNGSLYGVTCTAQPSTVGGVTTVQFTINTTANQSAALRPFPGSRRGMTAQTPFYALLLSVPGLILFGVGASALGRSGRRHGKRRWLIMLTVVLVIALLLLLPACGGGFKGSVQQIGNTKNYTLTAMGTVEDQNSQVVGVEIYTVSIVVGPQQ
jgi:hypothetical protein